jgi:hypothetical protein
MKVILQAKTTVHLKQVICQNEDTSGDEKEHDSKGIIARGTLAPFRG